MFKAYSFHIKEEEYQLIKKMGKVLTDENIHIYDLVSYEPDVTEEDTVIIYGEHARRVLQETKPKHKIVLRETTRYGLKLGTEEDRQEAYDSLLILKEYLDSLEAKEVEIDSSKQIFTEESLPALTSIEIRDLEAILIEKGILYWEGLTKDGKKIRLTRQPGHSSADINMTFSELYAIRSVIETLQVTKLEVIYEDIPSRKDPS